MPESNIELARETIAGMLQRLDDFSGVTVLTKRQGDIVAQAQKAIGEQGVFVEVVIRSAALRPFQSKAVLCEPLKFALEIGENVPVNQGPHGTGKGAWWLFERAAAELHNARLGDSNQVITVGDEPARDITPRGNEDKLIVQGHFTTKVALGPPSR